MRPRHAVLLAVLALLLAVPASARADDAAALYDPGSVAAVDLTIDPAGVQALEDDSSTYVGATLSLAVGPGGARQTLGPYAIQARLKGHSTFRPITGKAAFRLKLPKGQRPFGLKGLTLNNLTEDPSAVHETLAYAAFRAAGLPAPRTGFAYVRLNGDPMGLYLDLERYDDVSLPRLFPTTRHLLEGEYGADATPERRGDLEVDEGDATDLSDLDALVAAAAGDGDLGAVADLDEMTRVWAMEHVIGYWDSYSVSQAYYTPNNYYLHSDAAGRFSLLPSGTDQAFTQAVDLYRPGTGGVLFKRCMADAGCAARYRAAVAAVAGVLGGLDVDAVDAVVRPWAAMPSREPVSTADRDAALAATRAFLAARPGQVAAWLAGPAAAGTAGAAGSGTVRAPAPAVTPAAANTRPVAKARCVVPRLRALTLTRARAKLRAAGCRLGAVRRLGHRGRHGLRRRVRAVAPRAGAVRIAGTRVAVTLAPRR